MIIIVIITNTFNVMIMILILIIIIKIISCSGKPCLAPHLLHSISIIRVQKQLKKLQVTMMMIRLWWLLSWLTISGTRVALDDVLRSSSSSKPFDHSKVNKKPRLLPFLWKCKICKYITIKFSLLIWRWWEPSFSEKVYPGYLEIRNKEAGGRQIQGTGAPT